MKIILIFSILFILSAVPLIAETVNHKAIFTNIQSAPKEKRELLEELYFAGWDAYYRNNLEGSLFHWEKIRSDNAILSKELKILVNKTRAKLRDGTGEIPLNDRNFILTFTNKMRNINRVEYNAMKRFFLLAGLSKKDADVVNRYITVIGPITDETNLKKLYKFNKKKIDILKRYFIFEGKKIIFKADVLKKVYIEAVIDGKKEKGRSYKPEDKIILKAYNSLRLRISDAGRIKALINEKPIDLGKKGEIINKIFTWEEKEKKGTLTIKDFFSDRKTVTKGGKNDN
ncbi:MAG: hypothetical protein KKH98_05095 [Spirochaetes bacterium]|nr:hypothetical protein [Spirochaetota bacterium]